MRCVGRHQKAPYAKTKARTSLLGACCAALAGVLFLCSPASAAESAGLKAGDWHAKWIGLDGVEQTNWLEDAYPGFLGSSTRLSWIWFPAGEPEKSAPPGTFYFRREIVVPTDKPPIKEAHFQFAGDNECRGWVNGVSLGAQKSFHQVRDADVTGRIVPGTNLLCLAGINDGRGPKPAGVIACLRIDFTRGDALIFWTDDQWKVSHTAETGWNQPGFEDSKWTAAKTLGLVGMQPWGQVRIPESRRLPARFLRKDFLIEKKVARATVYFSGLGWSELYLNGGKVGDTVLSPGVTDYAKRVLYVTHDVTKQLHDGTNTFGAILGNGTYYAPRSEVSSGTASFGWPKMSLQLRIEYSDGSAGEVVSDESWQLTAQGPVRANSILDGEEYDANYNLEGWNNPGYEAAPLSTPPAAAGEDASGRTTSPQALLRKYNPPPGTIVPDSRPWKVEWQPAQVVSAPAGEMTAQTTEPIRVTQTLRPVALTEPKPGLFVFDMGRNLTGWCRLKVTGPAECLVTLQHAPTLNPNGTIDVAELQGARAMDTYTLRGTGGAEVWEPRFTCHTFRYVEVTGFPEKPTLDSIEGRVVSQSPAGP